MQGTLRTAHLVVGAIAIVAFLVTGMLMNAHRPPVMQMDWDERLLFNSRHIYLMAAGLVNLAIGIHYRLPEPRVRQAAAIFGSLLVFASAAMLFFAFFAEPMAGRWPGRVSGYGLFALFGGVLAHVLASLHRRAAVP